jgi:hypothetical protein
VKGLSAASIADYKIAGVGLSVDNGSMQGYCAPEHYVLQLLFVLTGLQAVLWIRIRNFLPDPESDPE